MSPKHNSYCNRLPSFFKPTIAIVLIGILAYFLAVVRVDSLAAALVMAETGFLLVAHAVAWLMPLLHAHTTHTIAVWIAIFCSLFAVFPAVAVAVKSQRTKAAESDVFTPLVRRSPTTGLREL
jgi:hypothetical protein